MEDTFDALERTPHRTPVEDVAGDALDVHPVQRLGQAAPARSHAHVVATAHELADDRGADEAGPTCHENLRHAGAE